MKFFPRLRFRSDERELTAISFTFLILTDIFVAYILFFGLSQQIAQLSDEDEYFPYFYRDMLIEQSWVETTIVADIAEDTLSRARSTWDRPDLNRELHPACRDIEIRLRAISEDPAVMARIEAYDRARENYWGLDDAKRGSAEGALILAQVDELEQELRAQPSIAALIEAVYKAQSADYTNTIKNYRKFFAAKRLVFDFLFLLPIVALFILWNRIAQKKGSSLNVVISSHYILVSLIPILFEVLRLILEVIPTVFLKAVYDLLVSLRLVTLWYYAVLLLSIVFIIFILWILQTKIFTRERHDVKRYGKSLCMHCDAKIDYGADFCPACGNPLSMECPACKGRTIRRLPYCQRCGNAL